MRPNRSRALRFTILAAITIVAATSISFTSNVQTASADGCDDLNQRLIDDFEMLAAARERFRVTARNRVIAQSQRNWNLSANLNVQMDQDQRVINAAENEIRRHIDQWYHDCGDGPPPGCSATALQPYDLLFQALRARRMRRNAASLARSAAELAGSLIPSAHPEEPFAVGRVLPDGSFVDPITGTPILSPLSTPADPDYIQFRLGMGIQAGSIYAIDLLQIQVRNAPGPTTLVQVFNVGGQPVQVSPVPPGTPTGAWTSWASTYLHINTDGLAIPLAGIAAGAATMLPQVRQAIIELARTVGGVGGLVMLRLLLGHLERPAGCDYNIQVAYSSPQIDTPSTANPFSASLLSSRAKALALPPTPPASTPPPDSDPPDTGSGGGGGGIVAINASTCRGISGPWEVRTFVGAKESGAGISYRFKSRLGTSWRGPDAGAQAFIHISDGRDTDPNSEEAKQLGRQYMAQIKQQAMAAIAGSRARLVDPDGFGRGRPAKLELKGPFAPGVGRMTLRPGCNIATPVNYREQDTPE